MAPSEDGCDALAREILSCLRDLEYLAGLAYLYVHGLIRVCASLWSTLYILAFPDLPLVYNPKGPMPAVSTTMSPRFPFHRAVENVEHILQQPSINCKQLRQLASMFVGLAIAS